MAQASEHSTYCTAEVWDEAVFDYVRVLVCARYEDKRAEFLALHDPPLIRIEYVRYDSELILP